MKIKDILNESYVDDHGYGIENTDLDAKYNPEAVNFARENLDYYGGIDYDEEETPVFVRIEEDPDTHKKLDTHPQRGEEQSAGYRGRERVKQRAGHPHYKYDEHEDRFVPDGFRDGSKDLSI